MRRGPNIIQNMLENLAHIFYAKRVNLTQFL